MLEPPQPQGRPRSRPNATRRACGSGSDGLSLEREIQRQLVGVGPLLARTMAPSAPPAEARPQITAEALRSALISPGASIEPTIGSRPAGLAGRDLWLRAAAELVAAPGLVATPSDLHGPDIGLEL